MAEKEQPLVDCWKCLDHFPKDQLEDGKCYSCNEYNEDDPEFDAEFW